MGALVVAGLAGGAVFVLRTFPSRVYVATSLVSGDMHQEERISKEVPSSAISGLPCEFHSRRPFAVMMASDPEARPLSGIGAADLVVEMPVVTGGITRILAVFQCELPSEIGSVRSARHDFIPLAMGVDAVFVHWGGSHYALSELNRGIIENINALRNPFGAFYRKPEIPRPHNGFTSGERLLNAATSLGYRTETAFEGYRHRESSHASSQTAALTIGYPYPFNIRYVYRPEKNTYARWRGDKAETDRLTSKQVEAKNVIVMRASSRQIEGQYNDVEIEGEGGASIYQNGREIYGKWMKDRNNPASALSFYDERGSEVEFVPGSIWIQVVEPYQRVKWELIPDS